MVGIACEPHDLIPLGRATSTARKLYEEGVSLALVGDDTDPSIMTLHDFLGERQTEALPEHMVIEYIVGLWILLKDTSMIFGRDLLPSMTHLQPKAVLIEDAAELEVCGAGGEKVRGL